MSKKKASKEEALIKDYRDYVLWRRVSTKEQGRSELGLDAQLTYALEFTKKNPVQVFTDVVSGTKLRECTNLWKAIDYCKEHGTYLLVAKTDRFRNVEEACEVLRKVGEENLRFCDLPNCNEMVLKMLWVVWEYQARMGQINTRLAPSWKHDDCYKGADDFHFFADQMDADIWKAVKILVDAGKKVTIVKSQKKR